MPKRVVFIDSTLEARMKTVCNRHMRAYEVSEGCLYCPQVKTPRERLGARLGFNYEPSELMSFDGFSMLRLADGSYAFRDLAAMKINMDPGENHVLAFLEAAAEYSLRFDLKVKFAWPISPATPPVMAKPWAYKNSKRTIALDGFLFSHENHKTGVKQYFEHGVYQRRGMFEGDYAALCEALEVLLKL